MQQDNLLHRLGISLIPGVGPVLARKLIAYCGSATEVFKQKYGHLVKIPGIGEVLARDIANNHDVLKRAEEEVEFLAKNNISPLFYTDDDYPKRLNHCTDAPLMLFCKGNKHFNTSHVVAIVGTRNATDYGKQMCDNLLSQLAEKLPDIIIVSGLAYGIDAAAHKAAIKHGLSTVAVLGHGLERVYPSQHKHLADDMLQKGALLSEYMNNTPMMPEHFVQRNRVVSGMSDVVVVIESGAKGGALITAELAWGYNREVMAVPGNVGQKYSEGCNALIKQQKASVVETADDILVQMNWDKTPKPQKNIQIELFVEMSDEERAIADLLRSQGDTAIDVICSHTRMPMSKVSSLLLNMEFSGLVKSKPGKMYALTR